MIVSHKHRFVFLHSRKTAGSAVTLSLLRYLEPDDWWLNAPAHGIMNDALRSGFVPPPVRHPAVQAAIEEQCGPELATRVLAEPARLDRDERRAVAQAYNSLQEPHPVPGGWQHLTAAAARAHVGEEVWTSYLTFSMERNPWDRMASLYWWRVRADDPDHPAVSFRDFIAAIHSGDRRRIRANRAANHSNWPIYTIDDQVAVDRLGRYENLVDELHDVLARVGVTFDGWLPKAKHRTRRSGLDELYDEETVRLVGEIFDQEIALLGYQPPPVARPRFPGQVRAVTRLMSRVTRR